jgi:cob(I)alamin adenosyltransferase
VLRISNFPHTMFSNIKIYTKSGDKGQTSLYGGKRVDKSDARVEAYGTIDELNSAVGVVISHLEKEDKLRNFLSEVQSDLFTIGTFLAGNKKQPLDTISKRVPEMEQYIDEIDSHLPPLKNFILPSGTPEASFSHLARSICRRAEREVVRLTNSQKVEVSVITYLNRLSDFLFIVARYLNMKNNILDAIWKTIG